MIIEDVFLNDFDIEPEFFSALIFNTFTSAQSN